MPWTNLIIGYTNYAGAAATAITADQSNANFPASNMGTDQRQMVWKTTDGTPPHYFTVDLGSSLSPTLAMVFDVNVRSAADSVLLIGSDNANMSSPTYASTAPTAYSLTTAGSTSHLLRRSATWLGAGGAALAQARYWRFGLHDAGGSNYAPVVDSVYICGKVFIGLSLIVAKNYAHPITWNDTDLSITTRTPNGASNTNRRGSRMGGSFEIPLLSLTDSQNVETLTNLVGTATPITLIFDYSNDYARRTFFAKLTQKPQIVHVEGNLYSHRFEWAEEL